MIAVRRCRRRTVSPRRNHPQVLQRPARHRCLFTANVDALCRRPGAVLAVLDLASMTASAVRQLLRFIGLLPFQLPTLFASAALETDGPPPTRVRHGPGIRHGQRHVHPASSRRVSGPAAKAVSAPQQADFMVVVARPVCRRRPRRHWSTCRSPDASGRPAAVRVTWSRPRAGLFGLEASRPSVACTPPTESASTSAAPRPGDGLAAGIATGVGAGRASAGTAPGIASAAHERGPDPAVVCSPRLHGCGVATQDHDHHETELLRAGDDGIWFPPSPRSPIVDRGIGCPTEEERAQPRFGLPFGDAGGGENGSPKDSPRPCCQGPGQADGASR